MEAVARDLGCSPQAIGRRFGSKRGLIRAYVGWAMGGIGERFRESRRTHTTALEALRARVFIPAEDRQEEIGDTHDAARRANMLSFWIAIRADAEFRPLLVSNEREIEAETTNILNDAVAAGELRQCDTVILGRVLIAALTGTTMTWSEDEGSGESLVDQLGRALEAIVGPYRASGSG